MTSDEMSTASGTWGIKRDDCLIWGPLLDVIIGRCPDLCGYLDKQGYTLHCRTYILESCLEKGFYGAEDAIDHSDLDGDRIEHILWLRRILMEYVPVAHERVMRALGME